MLHSHSSVSRVGNWCRFVSCWSCSWRNARPRTRRRVRVTERRSSSCGTDCRCPRRRGRPSTNTWWHPGRGTWKRWEDWRVLCAADFLVLVMVSYDCQFWCSCSVYTFILCAQLQAEVLRLEELKLLNIRNVTDAIRSEIAVFWEKCFFSTDQRQDFAPYFSGGFSCFDIWIVLIRTTLEFRL